MARRIWAGLDVGVETTSVCIIDDAGDVLHQATCPSALTSVHREIARIRRRKYARVGVEASNAATLARGLRSLGYSVDLYETRQLSKFLRVRRNKTDAGDASGIAELGRLGASLVSKVYLKTLEAQALQSRLTIRRHLIRHRVSAVNLLCRQLELYGGRVSRSTRSMQLRAKIEVEIKTLFGRATNPLPPDFDYLLEHCEQLIAYQYQLDGELKRLAANNEVCRRFMQIPGVGPICALTFYAAVGDPHRFKRSSDIGSYLGLTPKLHQSGLTMRLGRISRMGNRTMRTLLTHASLRFMHASKQNSDLLGWASEVEQRRGRGQARVALARKLAVVMVAMWKKGEDYQPNYPGHGEISEQEGGRIGPRKPPGAAQRAFCLGAGPCRSGEEAVERQAGPVSALG
jgi:transposase